MAITLFAETLKMELGGSNVHATTICPGVVNTEIVRGHLGVAP